MCIINSTFGYVFVHVPKSAGTSVTMVLSRLCTVLDIEVGGSEFGEAVQFAYMRRHGLTKHSSAREIRSMLGEQQWARFTSFGVVRHPLERLASTYRFLQKWDAPQNKLLAKIKTFETFQDFVESDIWCEEDGPDRVFRPQAFWLSETTRNELLVDRVCRVESLEEDLRALLLDLKVKPDLLPVQMPHSNATEQRGDELQLSEPLLEKVRARYARDLSLFGYTV